MGDRYGDDEYNDDAHVTGGRVIAFYRHERTYHAAQRRAARLCALAAAQSGSEARRTAEAAELVLYQWRTVGRRVRGSARLRLGVDTGLQHVA